MKKISLIILSILVLSSCGKKSNSISGPTRTDFGKYIDKCIEKNGTGTAAKGGGSPRCSGENQCSSS